MGMVIFFLMVIGVIAVVRYIHQKEANKKWDVVYDDELQNWKYWDQE